MRAVDALMECLKAEGVDVVFGLPGGANLPTYDALVDGGVRRAARLRPRVTKNPLVHSVFFQLQAMRRGR